MTQERNMKISPHCILACLYFLLLPTTIVANSAGNSILKLATIPIAGYFVISIIFSKKEIHFNSVHFLLCLYTFTTLITLFLKSDTAAVDAVTGYFLNAALYLCITVIQYNEKELQLLDNIQVVLLAIFIAITLFAPGSDGDRTTLTLFGQTSDPNYFVGYFVFPLAVTLKKIVHSKYRIVYVLLAFLCLYCVFLSGSRGGLLAIMATLVAFAMIYPPRITTKFWLGAAGAAFLMFGWFIIAPLLPESVAARFSVENVVETGGTGRWNILLSMLDEIINSPQDLILGRGLSSLHRIFKKSGWASVGSHNQLVQVLYNQGVVGLIAFVSLVCGCLLRCIKKRKIVSIAIIGMMILSISLSFGPTTRPFWNLIAYAALNFPENETQQPTQSLELSEEDER